MPIPDISPIIVAAIPISNSMDVDELLYLLKKVLDGLYDHGICVVSYACDGTEVERGVQKRFLDQHTLKCEYAIKNPRHGRPITTITYGLYHGQAICMVQDLKHALKTLRNNLFSGARLLILGNFTAMFRRILLAAQGGTSPSSAAMYTNWTVKMTMPLSAFFQLKR